MSRIEKLKEFLEAEPQDAFLQHALAMEYIKIGDYELAKKQLEELLAENEDYIGSYYHLGQVYEKLEMDEMAKTIYEKGIQIAEKLEDKHARSELETVLWELED